MNFSVSMTKAEKNLGAACFLIQFFLLPSLLVRINQLLPVPLSKSSLNAVFFVINFAVTAAVFHRFFRQSLKLAASRLRQCAVWTVLGVCLHYAFNILIGMSLQLLIPDFRNVNDASVMEAVHQQFWLLLFCTVILVPPAEEVLFRGLLFRELYSRSRFAAYALSSVCFSAVHVMGYAGKFDISVLLGCFLQYLPAGLILARAYEKTDTIVTPVLIHMLINLAGILILR